MLELYPQEVKLVFKNFPLKKHEFAGEAAAAALAADKQGMFWEFHNQLFEQFDQLNDDKVREISQTLGLNKEKFENDKKAAETIAKITEDKSEGNKLGVQAIPTVFVNGRVLRNKTFEGFQARIEKELKKIRTGEQ